ncbi:hypothetical protein PVBG_06012 [Plasmodium vivax Brazil I]|uniref:Uncharacterized protein n=1 Tax=Plasmodium vivax (strain Brazil I) TaxID=1033975 RepID=A0A0J9SZR3_PLAV1|nr:hypothetical protein PVBG_06012 [Plasmodium vivax Brazil I]
MPTSVKLADIFAKTKIKEEDQKTYGSAFSELLRHINNGSVFYNYNKEGCWYISYILQREVDEFDKREYTSHVHDLLKEFILKFNINRSTTSNICMNDYVHINPDTYKIMNELYRLYDMYTKYKPIYENTIPLYCENFSDFIRYYNGFINTYKSGTDSFNKILNHFDKEVKESVSKYKRYECNKYSYAVSKLNLHTPPEPEQTIAPVRVQRQETLNALGTTGLQNSHDEVAHYPGTPESELLRVGGEDEKHVAEEKPETTHDQERTRDYVVSPEQGRVFKPGVAHNAERSHEHGITQGFRTTYNEGREGESLRARLSPYSQDFSTPDSSVHQELGDVSSFSQKLDTQTENEGMFANVRSTITGVLKDVEPAPILGVSGGMGALFLLFKYTPVGTFFRGRRGRTYGIPSGFNGPFPGEFPGYQDYLGGNIGYSQMSHLAE